MTCLGYMFKSEMLCFSELTTTRLFFFLTLSHNLANIFYGYWEFSSNTAFFTQSCMITIKVKKTIELHVKTFELVDLSKLPQGVSESVGVWGNGPKPCPGCTSALCSVFTLEVLTLTRPNQDRLFYWIIIIRICIIIFQIYKCDLLNIH